MLSFGLMTVNTSNEKSYFFELAKRAQSFDIECFLFAPSAIHPITEEVTGKKFNSKTYEWERKSFPLPKIIYDRCFYGEDSHSNQCKAIVQWLKTRKDILFLGHGLPNKFELYQALSQSNLSPYLLHSKLVTSGEDLMEELLPHQPVVIKPVSGSQGRGIYYLEKQDDQLDIRTDKQDRHISRSFTDTDQAVAFLNGLMKDRSYLVQPYMELLDDQDRPFDIRTLLQKDTNKNWQEICRGIRTGQKDGLISNLSAGGSISTFESWIESQPKAKKELILYELKEILIMLPNILEEKFPPLFELGVDIGVSKNGAIWILDINSKPGRKVALEINPQLVEKLYTSPLLYGKSLVCKERSSSNEKTISS